MYLNLNILVSIFCWGIWGIADKKALHAASQIEVIIYLYIVTALLVPIAALVTYCINPSWQLNHSVMFWTGLAAATYLLAMFAYIGAMKRTEASYVLGITASYPLILQFLATIFLKEPFVPQRMLGAIVIASGLILIGGSGAEKSSSSEKKGKMLVWFLIAVATLCWGIYGLFDKKALESGSALEVFVSQRLWDIVALGLIMAIVFLRKTKLDFTKAQAWLFCAISGAALALGGFCYLQALARASASYVITITGCYPLVMYFFALLLLKEKFNRNRFVGILLIVVGGILVQLTQS